MLCVFLGIAVHDLGPGNSSVCECPLVHVPTSRIYLRREKWCHTLLNPLKVTFFAIVEYVFFSVQAEIHELLIDLENLSICKTESLPIY